MIKEQIERVYKENNFGKVPLGKNKIFYPTRIKTNYLFGVPLKYLSRETIKDLGDLIEITEKYSNKNTEFKENIKLDFEELSELTKLQNQF